MTDSPVRIVEDFPSSPVRITNLQELVDYINETMGINTTGTHVEFPTRWDDLKFPSQGINPAGATSPPSVDNVVTGFPGTLLFSGNAINIIAGIAQMPHTWKEGTDIRPHIHWSKTVASAAAVSWQFRYKMSNIASEVWTAWSAWLDPINTIGNPDLADSHVMTSFPHIDMTGYRISTIINWQIQRVGTTDANNDLARLFEFDIHYEVDTLGSTTPGEK